MILNNIDLEIKPNTITALMGPNGSGKSSLSLALVGDDSVSISSGKILLDGEDLSLLSPEERSKKGLFLAFQYPLEIDGVRLISFLKLIYETHSKEKIKLSDFLTRVNKLAADLNISKELLNRYLNVGFSGGEKKKIEILQMLIIKPKYIILDETDSGLDISALKTVSDSIIKLKKEQKCGVLLITHYLRFLKYIKPDTVHIVMNHKIVKSGDYSLAEKLDESGYEKIIN